MSEGGSKRKQEAPKARCPLCRLPFEGDFKGGENEPVMTITQQRMTEIMNKYGGCKSTNINPETKLYVAPVLKKGEVYATYAGTKECVQMWCRVEGPHECERSRLLLAPCKLSLDPDKGCVCDSLPYEKKQALLACKWQTMEEKEMQTKKQKPAADEQSDQPAPTLFQNNQFDTIPEPDTTEFVYLAGTARLVDGTWTFKDGSVCTKGIGKAVYVASKTPYTGVLHHHCESGWCVECEDGGEHHFSLTRESPSRPYCKVYLILN